MFYLVLLVDTLKCAHPTPKPWMRRWREKRGPGRAHCPWAGPSGRWSWWPWSWGLSQSFQENRCEVQMELWYIISVISCFVLIFVWHLCDICVIFCVILCDIWWHVVILWLLLQKLQLTTSKHLYPRAAKYLMVSQTQLIKCCCSTSDKLQAGEFDRIFSNHLEKEMLIRSFPGSVKVRNFRHPGRSDISCHCFVWSSALFVPHPETIDEIRDWGNTSHRR